MDGMAEKKAFITMKGHKKDFHNNPKCRLIRPAQNETSQVIKQCIL